MNDLSETEVVRLNELITQFDFKEVHKCMTLMNWKWAGVSTENGVPSLDDIKKNAKRLVIDVIKSYLRTKTSGSIGTGGFEISYNHYSDYIEMKFVVAEWTDDYILEEDVYKTALKSEKRKKTIKTLLDGK
jgi:hypothetical protein